MENFDMSGGTPKKIEADEDEQHELVEFSEFKGNPMIVLRRTPIDKYPYQFGITKAKMIMSNIDAIEKFVEDNKK